MPITTSGVGLNQQTNLTQEYVPPTVITSPSPISVEWGTGIGLSDGQDLPIGTYLIVSGTLVASGSVQAIPVTITGSSPP
jgi:hypothetical protein